MSLSASDVSIITVNWNGSRHLKELLPSLLEQEAGEIIVVDNGSVDDSVSFLERNYPQVRILKNKINQGFAQPNNLAAAQARGQILAFINNDMKADPNWLRKGLSGLAEFDCLASRILSWDGKRIDFNGSSLQYLGYALQVDTGELLSSVTGRGGEILFPCGGAMFIRKKLFLDSGGFDPDFFAIYEDVDLGWRLWLSGYRVGLEPESVVYHKGHATFATQDNSRMRYLMHRNALWTILKNYQEETVRKVFPLALMMAVRRAVRSSGVDRNSFYIWAEAGKALEAGDPARFSSILDSLNHLVAVDDTIRMLPDLIEKRRRIQAQRKVEEREILNLFRDPLRPIVEEADYIEDEARLLESLGLDAIMDTEAYRQQAREFDSSSHGEEERCRRELSALQWMGGYALLHPTGPSPRPSGRIGKFMAVVRARGWKSALGRAWQALKD